MGLLTVSILIDASPAGDALCQAGFPHSQVTDECNNIAGVKLTPNFHADFLRFFGTMCFKGGFLPPYRKICGAVCL